MLNVGETKIAKKKLIIIWDVTIDNIVISKLIETKTNFNNLIGKSLMKL